MCSKSHLIISAVIFLMLAMPALATPKRYTTTVGGRLSQFLKPQGSKTNSRKNLALTVPATVNVVVPNYGKVKISFFSAQAKDWQASFESSNGIVEDNKDLSLFKGVALFESSNEEVPVAGSVFKVNGVPRATIHFSAPETNSPSASADKRDLFELRFSITQEGQISE